MKLIDLADVCSRIRKRHNATRVRIDVYEDRYEIFVVGLVRGEHEVLAGRSGQNLAGVLNMLEGL